MSKYLCLPWVFHSGRSVLSPGGPCAVRPICTASRSAGRLWRSTCWPSPPHARGTAALWGASPAWARSGGVRWTASCLGEWPWGTPRSTTPRRSRMFLPRPEEGPAHRTGTGPVRVAYLGWTWRRWQVLMPVDYSLLHRESWARCGAMAEVEAVRPKMRPVALDQWCSARSRFS